MKWVPQLNDIRISLPEFRGRSPTLILMLYVNELYVYCPSQSSVQDLYAGIIQLYPKINLEREIGFPVFFFGCPYAEIIFSLHVILVHSSLASATVKTHRNFGNFVISHGQWISLPVPKLERSIADLKYWAILQPTYSLICPGSSRQTQAKCFTLFSLRYILLNDFLSNHTYSYSFTNSFFSSIFCLKFKEVRLAILV